MAEETTEEMALVLVECGVDTGTAALLLRLLATVACVFLGRAMASSEVEDNEE